MFGFLRDKLKKAIAKFSKDVDEEAEDVRSDAAKEEPKEQKNKGQEKAQKAKESIKGKTTKEKKTGKEEQKKEKEKKETKETGHKKEKPVEKKEEIPAKTTQTLQEIEEVSTAKEKSEPAITVVEQPEKQEEKREERGFFARIKETFTKKEEKEEGQKEEQIKKERKETEEKEIKETPKEEQLKEQQKIRKAQEEHIEEGVGEEQEKEKHEKEKKGFFGRLTEAVTKKTLSGEKFDELFWELEVALLENNVASEVVDKIKDDLKKALVETKIDRGRIEETISETLNQSLEDLFTVPTRNLLDEAKQKKPYVLVFVGVNGSGKTTTIAKLAKYFQNHKLTCVIGAGDTFRAAAIQQLEEHANKIGVKLIKHDYGADPAAVAFDTVKYATQKGVDVVLIDTAGRLHSNVNLMDEMKKIIRVVKPDMKIFIGESITGNDCIEQAKQFHDAIGIDGIILTKSDVDEKGGAALSVTHVTGKPILYLGVGQKYTDMTSFQSETFLKSVGL